VRAAMERIGRPAADTPARRPGPPEEGQHRGARAHSSVGARVELRSAKPGSDTFDKLAVAGRLRGRGGCW